MNLALLFGLVHTLDLSIKLYSLFVLFSFLFCFVFISKVTLYFKFSTTWPSSRNNFV